MTYPTQFAPDSIEAIREDIRLCWQHYGRQLREWPLVRAHLVNRLAALKAGATAQ